MLLGLFISSTITTPLTGILLKNSLSGKSFVRFTRIAISLWGDDVPSHIWHRVSREPVNPDEVWLSWYLRWKMLYPWQQRGQGSVGQGGCYSS